MPPADTSYNVQLSVEMASWPTAGTAVRVRTELEPQTRLVCT